MKRFLLFAGRTYYSAGGWGDFKGSFDTHKDAKLAGEMLIDNWFHIIDTENPPSPEDV